MPGMRRKLNLTHIPVSQLESFAFKRPNGIAVASCNLGDGNSLADGEEICLNDEVWFCSDGVLLRKKPAELCT